LGVNFNVTLGRNEGGVWVVECPAIPGCDEIDAEILPKIQKAKSSWLNRSHEL
jgi:hypothetical protein